jgi:hypothetical protein
MKDTDTFVNLYNSVWNEADAGRRREIIAELWSEDATHYTHSLEAHGHEAIEDRVFKAYEKFVVEGGYEFKTIGFTDEHHKAVRYSWAMVTRDGGVAVAAGTVFMLLDDDGRIRSDYLHRCAASILIRAYCLVIR